MRVHALLQCFDFKKAMVNLIMSLHIMSCIGVLSLTFPRFSLPIISTGKHKQALRKAEPSIILMVFCKIQLDGLYALLNFDTLHTINS